MTGLAFTTHDFVPAHLPELVDLWVASWQAAMPEIDFEARRVWFVDHLSALQSAGAEIVCAFGPDGAMAGFVTINTGDGTLDQLAVSQHRWGSGAATLLLAAAKRRAPGLIELEVNQDNPRAVRFYEKHGFVRIAESVNPGSGLKTWRYRWRSG